MSIIGPRPQLVRDMVFMTDEQRMRHTAKPGLSGLAQTRGRNALSWDAKLATDLEYIENIVVVCYNRLAGLKRLLQSLLAADYTGRRDTVMYQLPTR